MFGVLVVVHLIVSLCLIGAVLLQSGRGGGLAGVFGESSATQAMFGGRGAATFLTRATWGLGSAFFLLSMLLAVLTTSTPRAHKSLIQQRAAQQTGEQPTGTAPPATRSPGTSAPAQPTPTGGGTK
jgi:preprotein translocase subunit SecG